jgi:hypothetical protein
MKHPILGVIDWENGEPPLWNGRIQLPDFARFGRSHLAWWDRPPEPLPKVPGYGFAKPTPESEAKLRAEITSRYGEGAVKTLDEITSFYSEAFRSFASQPAAAETDSAEEDEQLKKERKERLADFDAGWFTLIIESTGDADSPSPEQIAAYRQVKENAASLLPRVFLALAEMGSTYEQGKPSNTPFDARFHFAAIRISWEHRGGYALLAFVFDADWEQEHGCLVIYHPELDVSWGSDDDFEAAAYELNKRKRLDLHQAIANFDAEAIKRLLAEGADPNQRHPRAKWTPSQAVKEHLRRRGPVLRADLQRFMGTSTAAELVLQTHDSRFERHQAAAQEIERLLREAGAN